MAKEAAASFVFEGRLDVELFCAFARRRAQRLSLEIIFGALSPEAVEVEARGPSALIDAFEMACSLGPIDCLVLEVRRREIA